MTRLEYRRAWRAKHRDKINADARLAYHAKYKDRYRVRKLARLEVKRRSEGKGITGLCAACGEHTKLCKDHDHATGQWRGHLCRSCNLVLGHVKDSRNRLDRLSQYLKEWGK